MNEKVTDICRMSWKRLQGNSKRRGRLSRRGTMIPVAVTATVPGTTWRQPTPGLPRCTVNPRPSNLPRRSQSVPPALTGPVYVYPSTAQVISSLDLVSPNFPPPSQPLSGFLQQLYIQTPPLPEEIAMLSWYRDPDEAPDSAATDDLYPPSPIARDLPARSEGPNTQERASTDAHPTEARKPSVDFASVMHPRPTRALPLVEGNPSHPAISTPERHPLLQDSVDAPFKTQSRSPSPIFLGDPRRSVMTGHYGRVDGVGPRERAKRRRHTLQPGFFSPPLHGTPDRELYVRIDDSLGKGRRTVPSEFPSEGPVSSIPDNLDID
jgi:hypothetical protein